MKMVFKGDKLDAFLKACHESYHQRALTDMYGDSDARYAERRKAYAAVDRAWKDLDCHERE